jgi:hypothetical protein
MLREAEGLGLLVNDVERQYLMDSKGKPPADACGPMHESLRGFWPLAEWSPRRGWDQSAGRARWQGPHWGRRRPIEPGAMLHASVLERMKRAGYAPANVPEKYCVEE